MNWLNDNCRMMSVSEIIHSNPTPDIQVALTFDDGYQSLYEQAEPITSYKKLRPLVYLNTGWIGQSKFDRKRSVAELGHYPDESFLIWPEVKDLHDAGWEIGSHGVNHYNFTMTEENITKQELSLSKESIEKYINTECLHFAYPWGIYSKDLIIALRNAGYKYAAAAMHAKLSQSSNLFALPRMNIEKNYSFEDFKNIVKGNWDFLGIIHKFRNLYI